MSKKDAQSVEFKAGDVIVQEKTGCDSVYIVKTGQLEAYKLSAKNEKIPLGIIGSGEYIGEVSFLLDSPHTNSVVALTDCTLAKISKSYCDEFLKTLPPWFLTMVKGQAARLKKANDLLRKNNLVDDTLAASVEAFHQKESE